MPNKKLVLWIIMVSVSASMTVYSAKKYILDNSHLYLLYVNIILFITSLIYYKIYIWKQSFNPYVILSTSETETLIGNNNPDQPDNIV